MEIINQKQKRRMNRRFVFVLFCDYHMVSLVTSCASHMFVPAVWLWLSIAVGFFKVNNDTCSGAVGEALEEVVKSYTVKCGFDFRLH